MESPDSPPASRGSFYTPVMISLIGVFSASIALVVYQFILLKYCMRRNETTNNGAAELPAPQAPLLPTGVDQKLLETIPIIAYSTKEEGDDLFRVDQIECVVCLGELEHGEMVRLLPNCKHAFHVQCIDKWFVAHTSCPICRSPIVAPEPPLENNPSSSPPSPMVELPPHEDHNLHGGNDDITSNNDASSSGIKAQPFGLLRHCGSLVLPRERPSSSHLSITGLKRSLSMDESSVVIIDIQRECGRDCSSSSSSSKDDLVASGTIGARSIRHLDRVSTKLLRSFSRLRMGKNSETLPF